MHAAGLSGDEGVKRGQALDDNEIRPKGEAENKGKFLVIHGETGEDERDADDVAAALPHLAPGDRGHGYKGAKSAFAG